MPVKRKINKHKWNSISDTVKVFITVLIVLEKNADDALDAVQEGFITAFQKLDQYQGGGSFEGWLHKIVIMEK
ncbi:hypothetical protein N9P53_00710 [Flavobacteriaceae bacterium]|nr:hypothetical protein [Flavobacteriaceae bacterium]